MLDERFLIANLVNSKFSNDYEILIDFYNIVSEASLKANEYNAFQMKLQWFLDSLSSNNLTGHKELDLFKQLIPKYNLDINEFILMIEAKNIDLDSIRFNSQEELITYAKITGGMLYENLGKIAQISNKNSLQIINKIGELYAIVGIIRNSKFLQNKNIHSLIYSANSLEKSYEADLKDNIKNLIFYIKNQFSQLILTNQKTHLFSLLNIFTKNYIKSIERKGFLIHSANIFDIKNIVYIKLIFKFIFLKINFF